MAGIERAQNGLADLSLDKEVLKAIVRKNGWSLIGDSPATAHVTGIEPCSARVDNGGEPIQGRVSVLIFGRR